MKKLSRFFDDPIYQVQEFLLSFEQRQIRKALKSKYNNEELSNCFWTMNTKDQDKGLSNNEDEKTIQRFFYSQIGNFLAHRCFTKRAFFIIPTVTIISFLLLYFFFNSETYTAKYLLGGIVLFFGLMLILSANLFSGIVAHLFLPKVAVVDDEIKEVNATIKRCLVRDVDNDTPNDLKDRKRILVVDSEGGSVCGQILSSDLEFSSFSEEFRKTKFFLFFTGLCLILPIIFKLSVVLGLAFYYLILLIYSVKAKAKVKEENKTSNLFLKILLWFVLPIGISFSYDYFNLTFLGGSVDLASGYVLSGCIYLLVVIAFYTQKSPLEVRASLLAYSVKESGTELLIDKLGKEYFINLENARNRQIDNAKKDKTDFINIGKSTGLLFQRRDYFAPSEKNLDMGLSINDLSMHLFTLGASGTGKTYSVIRPIAKKWVDLKRGGMAVLDSKGVLPLEIKDYCGSDYLLISPNDNKFNPLLNMTADSISDVIGDICKTDDPFWDNSARIHIRNIASLIIENCETITFAKIAKFLSYSNEEILEKVKDIKSMQAEPNPYLEGIFNYWLIEFNLMDEKVKSNITATVRSWLGNITNHKVLMNWVDTESNDIDIEDVFKGSKIGLLVDEKLYGKGAEVITAICLRKLYDYAKKRGDKWQNAGELPVLLVADEVQSILTSADVENSAIARSLGLYLVMATQNIDGIYNRLNAEKGEQLLGNFANIIAFNCKSAKSNEFLSNRVGGIYKTEVSTYYGLPDSQSEINIYSNSASDKSLNRIGLFRRAKVSAPRLAYSFGFFGSHLSEFDRGSLENNLTLDNEKTEQHKRQANLSFNLSMLIDPNEINILLAKPRTAIAILNRANVIRRDVIDFEG